MMKLELLAPALNYECAISAINCGADAIYIAAEKFGARQNAKNTINDIEKIIQYAHIFNVKVYVTLNTILTDEELIEARNLIQKLYDIKTDAIIIQDFGILQLAIENKLPPIVIHMSTQADIKDVEKVKFFEDIGIKRVILARELSLNEIEKIRKNTSIELEHFIAGALCVSYSGQCYLSEYIGKRSANRGCCAQACRKKYSLVDESGKFYAKNKYLLSLKDNNLSKHLDKLVKAGIVSFKIEGRLKDVNYVKNNVLYYHNLLKKYPRSSFGVVTSDFIPNPEKTFNRGFCDDYLFNKKNNIYNFVTPKSVGELMGEISTSSEKSFCIKTKKEIFPQDGLCFVLNGELSGCLVNKVEKIKDGYKIYPNKPLRLNIKTQIYRNIDVKFNEQLEKTKTTRKINIKFVVKEDEISVFDENSNKEALKIEYIEKAKDNFKMKENIIKSLSKTQNTPFNVENIVFETDEFGFLPVSKMNEIRRELLENLKDKILSRYKVKKQKPIDIAKFPLEIGNYKLNVHNKKAQEFYEMCECNVVEKSLESTKDYKNRELMCSKHCLKKAFIGCDKQEKLFLVDEKNAKFPLEFDCKNCVMKVISID